MCSMSHPDLCVSCVACLTQICVYHVWHVSPTSVCIMCSMFHPDLCVSCVACLTRSRKPNFMRLGLPSAGKGTAFLICVSRPAYTLISASGEKKTQKNSKKKRTSGQVRLDKYCPRHATVAEKETDCSTQTTVLWKLMGKVKLVVSKLFLAVHRSSK